MIHKKVRGFDVIHDTVNDYICIKGYSNVTNWKKSGYIKNIINSIADKPKLFFKIPMKYVNVHKDKYSYSIVNHKYKGVYINRILFPHYLITISPIFAQDASRLMNDALHRENMDIKDQIDKCFESLHDTIDKKINDHETVCLKIFEVDSKFIITQRRLAYMPKFIEKLKRMDFREVYSHTNFNPSLSQQIITSAHIKIKRVGHMYELIPPYTKDQFIRDVHALIN